MTPTQLHPTDLIAVPVPRDARNIQITNSTIDVGGSNEHINSQLWCDTENFIQKVFEEKNNHYEILGTCTKSDIDFDVESYVDTHKTAKRYLDYTEERKYFDYPKYSFRSLLTANGLHFENPHEEIIYEGTNPERIKSAIQQNEKWQTAQNNIVEKLVILKRV